MGSDRTDQANLAVLDLAPLIEAFGSFDDDIKATLRLFLDSTKPLLDAVQAKLTAGDLAGVGEAAHSAKGAANVTGAFRLGAVCADICTALRNCDEAAVRRLAAALPGCFAEVADAVRRVTG